MAREIALGRLGEGPRLAATLSRVAKTAAAGGRRGHGVRRAAARADRRPDLGARGVGGGRDRRRPACCGCCCRSSAARCRACTRTSRSPGRSCSRPAGGWSSALLLVALGLGVTGAYLGHAAVAGRDRARALVDLARAARRARPGRGGAAPARSRRRRLARGRSALFLVARAAERRRDPGQAPDRRRRGGCVRGGRGGGEGGRVGRDRDRAVPAARGDARGPPRADPRPVLARALARRRRGRGADADRLRAVPGDRAAAGVRPGDGGRRGRAVRARRAR